MTSPDKRVPRLSDFPPDEREAIEAAIAAKRAARAAKVALADGVGLIESGPRRGYAKAEREA